MRHIILTILITFASLHLSAQQPSKAPITTTFWVAGVCGMCEKAIESAMDAKGILKADFDLSKNLLTVTYKPTKITESHIHSLLNEAGYDTEKSTCNDEQYSRVHGCCKYRELEKH